MGKGATSESGIISSELLICSGDVRSILLLPLVARCIETLYVCIWHMFVFMYVVVTVGVCSKVCCVEFVIKDSFLNFGVLKYVCVRDVMDVVLSVCIVTGGAVGARVWEV